LALSGASKFSGTAAANLEVFCVEKSDSETYSALIAGGYLPKSPIATTALSSNDLPNGTSNTLDPLLDNILSPTMYDLDINILMQVNIGNIGGTTEEENKEKNAVHKQETVMVQELPQYTVNAGAMNVQDTTSNVETTVPASTKDFYEDNNDEQKKNTSMENQFALVPGTNKDFHEDNNNEKKKVLHCKTSLRLYLLVIKIFMRTLMMSKNKVLHWISRRR